MSGQFVELQIILGFNCNFACRHCLNSSKPNFTAFDISESEISALAKMINGDTSIDGVAFNGGEPLLYIDKMLDLKSQVGREIHWSMTSNGSLLEQSFEKLKILHLDSAILSFDVYHGKFLDIHHLQKLIQVGKKIIPKLELNFVYEDISDFVLIQKLSAEVEINVIPTKIIRSGRSKNHDGLGNSLSQDFGCPNIKGERVKVSYVPQRGFTLCCGPLLFDHNLNTREFFVDEINDIFNTVEYRSFRPEYGENQILKIIAASGDACESCFKTFKKVNAGDFSRDDIDKLNRKFLKSNHYLNQSLEKSLSRSFHVKYLIRLDPDTYKKIPIQSKAASIEVTHLRKLECGRLIGEKSL